MCMLWESSRTAIVSPWINSPLALVLWVYPAKPSSEIWLVPDEYPPRHLEIFHKGASMRDILVDARELQSEARTLAYPWGSARMDLGLKSKFRPPLEESPDEHSPLWVERGSSKLPLLPHRATPLYLLDLSGCLLSFCLQLELPFLWERLPTSQLTAPSALELAPKWKLEAGKGRLWVWVYTLGFEGHGLLSQPKELEFKPWFCGDLGALPWFLTRTFLFLLTKGLIWSPKPKFSWGLTELVPSDPLKGPILLFISFPMSVFESRGVWRTLHPTDAFSLCMAPVMVSSLRGT